MAKKLYVGGLSYNTSQQALQDAFAQAGKVDTATIIMDKMTGRSKGFGFVEMANDDEAEKLLKLEVSLGEETRQIVSGIAKSYEPEALLGKEIVIVANLAPRTLMGLESHGMLLAAHGETPVILVPEKEVPPGASIS